LRFPHLFGTFGGSGRLHEIDSGEEASLRKLFAAVGHWHLELIKMNEAVREGEFSKAAAAGEED